MLTESSKEKFDNKVSNYKNLLSQNRDYIMGLAMISIMLFHQTWVKWLPLLGFRFYGNLGVDIFLFVSGFGLVYSLGKHNVGEFYKRRFIRLFPACLLIGLSKYLIGNIPSFHSIHTSIATIFALDMWYIKGLIGLYIVCPLLFLLIKKYDKAILIPVLLISIITIWNDFFGQTFSWTIVRLPAFVIGMMVAMEKITLNKRNFILGGIFVILALGYKALHFGGMIPIRGLYQYVLFGLGISSFCYGLIYIKPLFDIIHFTSFIKWMGKCSLEIYLWHVFIYDCINTCSWSPYLKLPVAIAIALTLAFVYNKVLSHLHLMERFTK